TAIHADLREPFELAEPVDAAVSVATLHWLPDHEAVFHNVARVLRPGGRFVAEAGGEGNVATLRHALTKVCGHDGTQFRNFVSVADTVERLATAGFRGVDVTLVPDP